MRSVEEYRSKADGFERLAAQATHAVQRRRYADLAACYRILADERARLIAEGTLKPEVRGRDDG